MILKISLIILVVTLLYVIGYIRVSSFMNNEKCLVSLSPRYYLPIVWKVQLHREPKISLECISKKLEVNAITGKRSNEERI